LRFEASTVKYFKRLYLENTQHRAGEVVHMVECLPNKHEALSSSTSSMREREREREREGREEGKRKEHICAGLL
jgi:hypothetical protein